MRIVVLVPCDQNHTGGGLPRAVCVRTGIVAASLSTFRARSMSRRAKSGRPVIMAEIRAACPCEFLMMNQCMLGAYFNDCSSFHLKKRLPRLLAHDWCATHSSGVIFPTSTWSSSPLPRIEKCPFEYRNPDAAGCC
jgi:hypothetical protein